MSPPLCKGRFSNTCRGPVLVTCARCREPLCEEHTDWVNEKACCWLCLPEFRPVVPQNEGDTNGR